MDIKWAIVTRMSDRSVVGETSKLAHVWFHESCQSVCDAAM